MPYKPKHKIKKAKFTDDTRMGIHVEINDVACFVPTDPRNRHYADLVAQGVVPGNPE
jgi:hypothetical protein